MKTSREGFALRKIKQISGGGLEIEFNQTVDDDVDTVVINSAVKNPILEHPDLSKLIDSLEDTFILEMGFNPTKTKKTIEYLKEKTMITGCSMKLEEESCKALITAKFSCTRGNIVAMNTPNLHWDDTHEIFEILTKLEDEVFMYLFENKKAQIEMDFSEPQSEQAEPVLEKVG